MRLVLDTNVLVSALISPGGLPDQLLQRWEADEFTLVSSKEQFDEIERVLGYKKLARFIRPDQTARLIANFQRFADFAGDLPELNASSDPSDNIIIATAIAGNSRHLVTGDKNDLLGLKEVEGVSIITVREAIELLSAMRQSP